MEWETKMAVSSSSSGENGVIIVIKTLYQIMLKSFSKSSKSLY